MKNLILLLVLLCVINTSADAENMQAYFADFINPATLEDINSSTAGLTIPSEYSGCNFKPPNVIFTALFTSGFAYRNEVLHGLSWENTDITLYSISEGPCAIGNFIGSQLGISNLESLAYCQDNDSFYSADFDYANHVGQLVRIDPLAQSPSLIGSHMTFDIRITGMVCDASGQLWAVTPGHGGRNSELLKINRSTGSETVIGATGIANNVVEALAIDRDKPNDVMYINGNGLYEVNKNTGNATFIGGSFNKIYAMAGLPRSDLIFENGFEIQ